MDRQQPFKINVTCLTSEMLGKHILSNLETSEAWVVPIYDAAIASQTDEECPHWFAVDGKYSCNK